MLPLPFFLKYALSCVCEVLESYEEQSTWKRKKKVTEQILKADRSSGRVTSPHRVYLAKIQLSVDKMEFEVVITGTQKELRMPQVKKCGHHHTEADLGEWVKWQQYILSSRLLL